MEVRHPSLVQDDQDQNHPPLWLDSQIATSGTAHSFKEVTRWGKFLIFELEPSLVLLSHLGFTGWWIPTWSRIQSPRRFLHPMDLNLHTRLIIRTTKGNLCLTDPRALSRLRLYRSMSLALSSRHLVNMGPDANEPAGAVALAATLPKTGRKIRDVIMDQQVISGIGNYLCCETLYRAKLSGAEKAKSLNPDQVNRLQEAIKTTIALAMDQDNTTWWAVFQAKKCPEGHPIVRIPLGTRGHYYCPICQGKWNTV